MRRFLSLAPLVFGLFACSNRGYYDRDENEIVFGIEQRTDAATGAVETNAGYEFLGLAHGSDYSPRVFRDGTDDRQTVCYFETADDRIGKPLVENGVATWSGGALGSPGLQVLGNQPDVTRPGAGWTSNDRLQFDVEGFAMPGIPSVTMRAPRLELAITAIAPAVPAGSTELALKATDSVGVTWTPATDPELASRVMVIVHTDDSTGDGAQVRCFARDATGEVIIPATWMAQLFSTVPAGAAVKGRLEVSSHRQTTIRARGDWTVYAVATVVHRELAFTGTR